MSLPLNQDSNQDSNARRSGEVLAPLLTPFSADGSQIDAAAFRAHLVFLERAGLDGVLLLGTNGEFGDLTEAEKWFIIGLAQESAPNLDLIIGATVPDSPTQTIQFACRVEEHFQRPVRLLVAPPFYDRFPQRAMPQGATAQEAKAQGATVAAGEVSEFYGDLLSQGLASPILAYNVPVPAAGPVTAAVTPAIVAALGDTGLYGLKDSSGDPDNPRRYLAARPDLHLLMGNDQALAAGREAGASGSITACANVFPSAVLRVWSAEGGDALKEAQAELIRLRQVLELYPGKLVAAQKALLAQLGVLPGEAPVRQKTSNLTRAERRAILEAMERVVASLRLNDTVVRLWEAAT